MVIERYALLDYRLELSWDRPSLGRVVRATLQYFGFRKCGHEDVVPAESDVRLKLLWRSVGPELPGNAEFVSRENGVDVYRDDGLFYACSGTSTVRLDVGSGTGLASVRSSMWRNPKVVRLESMCLIISSLLILLRRKRLYPLHSAALACGDRGVLVTADSDSGKSTLAMSLVRCGWSYLSDDSILLRSDDHGVSAIGLRKDFGLDDDAVMYFQEVDGERRRYVTDERKRRVNMKAVYPGRSVEVCVPRVLVFPRIVADATSRLVPIDRKTSIAYLMKHSGMLILDSEITSSHLDVLSRLVHQADGYELQAGRDLLQDGERFSEMLLQVVNAGSPHSSTIRKHDT